jgi:hypothetical protein
MKYIFLLFLLFFSININSSTKINLHFKTNNYVPDEKTAIKVAEAILFPIFGKEVHKARPYQVKLKNNEIWVIEGSVKRGVVGGAPYIEIQKSDCKVLVVGHTR